MPRLDNLFWMITGCTVAVFVLTGIASGWRGEVAVLAYLFFHLGRAIQWAIERKRETKERRPQ